MSAHETISTRLWITRTQCLDGGDPVTWHETLDGLWPEIADVLDAAEAHLEAADRDSPAVGYVTLKDIQVTHAALRAAVAKVTA